MWKVHPNASVNIFKTFNPTMHYKNCYHDNVFSLVTIYTQNSWLKAVPMY